MSKLETIIDNLLRHEISRNQALEDIRKITDGMRKKQAIECDVTEVAYTVDNKHGRIRLEIRYGYHKIEGKLKTGDKVDLLILP